MSGTTTIASLIYTTVLGTVLLLAACGGGGSGGGSPTAQPMEPDTGVSFSRANPTGEDLLDHWNQADAAQAALGLTTANVSRGAIGSLLNRADSAREDSRALMRNADPARLETIGEANGITYGTWQDGPAGTLNMQLDWSQAASLSAERRGDFERATKVWTYRLNEDFPARQVPAHEDYTYMLFEYDEPQTADDMLIAVELATWNNSHDVAGGNYFEWSERNGDLETWFGHIQIPPGIMQEYQSDFHWYMHVITHELGHTLPTNPAYDEQYGLRPNQGRYEAYLDIENGTFNGPNAMAANGGNPVPYQWIDEDYRPVAPNTPGARIDFGHIGPCDSIMSYCNPGDRVRLKPSELDFAILQDLGYDLLSASEADEPEVYGYGAWATYSAWGAGVERIIDYRGTGANLRITDRLSAHVDAFGTAPGMSFADASAGMTGSATWTGALLGVDIGRAMLPPVFGDAAMTVDLADLDGTLAFSNLTTAIDGEVHDFRRRSLDYAITVTGNGFGDGNGIVQGSFYGPGHEEMAGVLDDRSSGVNLIGGFGGVR